MEEEYIIFDTEYTAWEGAMESNWSEPWQYKEVVQISAIKIKKDKVVEEFNYLVRPSRNPLLSEYFVNLTGITNDLVQAQGISFGQAYSNFFEFAKGYVCYSNATGAPLECKSDGDILNINLDLNEIETTAGIEYKNISSIIYGIADEKKISIPPLVSGEFAKHLNLETKVDKFLKGSDTHYALYDCYSLFVSLQHLKNA